MHRRSCLYIAAPLILLAGCASEPASTSAPAGPEPSAMERSRVAMQNVMQTKLLHSRMLMEAIALEDFDDIHFNASELSALSRETEWMVHTTDRYVVYSERFREAVDALSDAASAKDIERVSTIYMTVTASCLECHTYLRQEGLTRDLPGVVSWAAPAPTPGG